MPVAAKVYIVFSKHKDGTDLLHHRAKIGEAKTSSLA